MKANYKVVNNRQAQLKKVIQDFEPTGACAFLMFRYYVMRIMAESEAAGGLDKTLSDSAEFRISDSVNEFFDDAKGEAVSKYMDQDEKSMDVIISFDGTPKEFAKEFEALVLVEMVISFEHALLDFSDISGTSRSQFELAVAKVMSEDEQKEGKIENFWSAEFEDED